METLKNNNNNEQKTDKQILLKSKHNGVKVKQGVGGNEDILWGSTDQLYKMLPNWLRKMKAGVQKHEDHWFSYQKTICIEL